MQGKKGSKIARSSASEPTAAQDAGASCTSEGGSNWLSRWRQKQDIRQSYYAAARSGTAAQTAGGKAASNGASAARSGVEQAVEKSKTAVSTAVKGLMNALMKNKIIGVCPNCGANVVEREKGWFCESNPCRFVLWKDNAFFKRLGKRLDAHVADKLLRDGRVRLKDCKSAKGKTYNATVLLSCEADGRSKFSLEFEGGC